MINIEKEPIISKWHKGKELEDKKIAEGFVSGETGKKEGVRRKIFETEEGKKQYVYKEVFNLQEAKDIMHIYRIFREANLPVVDFAKIIKKRIWGRDEFVVAMENLTEEGRLIVTERLRADIPEVLKIQMIKALAIIHNNGVYDYHPGLSFALREKQSEKGPEVVDFKVIDYANFEMKKEKQENIDEKINTLKIQFDETGFFDEECSKDLKELLRGIVSEDDEFREYLVNLYWKIRNSGNRQLE